MSWAAPRVTAPLEASVAIPGSKSLTNRYLVLAALGGEPARIEAPLIARDTLLMLRGLESMGAQVSHEPGAVTVTPAPLGSAEINAGLAGTVMRFLPAVAALATGTVRIDGDPASHARPMDPVVSALNQLGVTVDAMHDDAGNAVLPLTIHGTGSVRGGIVRIDASASSQFVSALLLAGCRMDRGIDIRHEGAAIPSMPHIDMTVDVLRRAGIEVSAYDAEGAECTPGAPATRWVVRPGVPTLGCVTVEPDLSNAGPFLAAAMVTGGAVSIERWPEATTQAGAEFASILGAMGATISFTALGNGTGTLTLRGPEQIRPLDMDMHDVGELVPTVAAVAAFAQGPSRLSHIGQLRGHETDRLSAIVAELERAGCGAHMEGDDIVIEPRPMHAATLRSYADHRMATFGAVIGLRVPIEVEDIATTAKTFPQFPSMWADLAAGAHSVVPEAVDPATELPA